MFDQVGGKRSFPRYIEDLVSIRSRMRDEYIAKKNSKTLYGIYVFVVVPFRLTNAPTTFMYLMNSSFSKYLDKSMLVLINNIQIYSRK